MMRTLIRTDDIPPGERLAFWNEEVVPRTWVPMETHVPDQGSFRAHVRGSDLGAIQVNLVSCTAMRLCRSPRLIRRAAPDLLKIAVVVHATSGEALFVQDERQASLSRPGDLSLYDTTRPYEVRAIGDSGADPWQVLTLHFPRTLLPLSDRQLREATAVAMHAREGVGALTSAFLLQLAAGADHYSPAEAARLATTALEVLAVRLAHELGNGAALPPEARRRALLARIHAFIQAHLGDPDLSPGTIAAASYVSPRYLHKLFQEDGETVAGWVRARRLEGARRDLADPTLTHRPVAAIAARWGFSSAAYFSRVFKATYQMPPQEYRQWALNAAGQRGFSAGQ
jgi:AraC-like DNA-binding protein